MKNQIETKNLVLIACDKDIFQFALASNQQLSDHLEVIVPDNWTEFGSSALKHSLDKLSAAESQFGWLTYLPIHKADNTLIGSCGYKGRPNKNGEVEIGYEIITAYRNKGLATELVKALVESAFSFDYVNALQAHTLGIMNASAKVLLKCGFQNQQ